MELTKDEIQRYGRHLILPEFGREGQLKLKNSKVLLVGAGGLGSPAAIYLSAAGVGTLGIVDADTVELSNLHRQVIHFSADVGKSKVVSAKEKMSQLNPLVRVLTHAMRLTARNAMEILKDYDLIVDGTDNFPTRYLINDACLFLGKPFVFGGIFRFEGQCSVFGLKGGPCYRCLFAEPPGPGEVPSCAEAGVLGVLPGIIGLLQANEAIKIICGIGEPLSGRLLMFDALNTQFREVRIKKDPQCALCSPHATIRQLAEYEPARCESPQGGPMESIFQNSRHDTQEITVKELKQVLDHRQDVCVVDVREPEEWDIVHLEGAVLKPLSNIENDFSGIPKDKPVYVYCKMGGRSAAVIEFLETKGYKNLVNVKGGIDAWAQEIDPSMPTY